MKVCIFKRHTGLVNGFFFVIPLPVMPYHASPWKPKQDNYWIKCPVVSSTPFETDLHQQPPTSLLLRARIDAKFRAARGYDSSDDEEPFEPLSFYDNVLMWVHVVQHCRKAFLSEIALAGAKFQSRNALAKPTCTCFSRPPVMGLPLNEWWCTCPS